MTSFLEWQHGRPTLQDLGARYIRARKALGAAETDIDRANARSDYSAAMHALAAELIRLGADPYELPGPLCERWYAGAVAAGMEA